MDLSYTGSLTLGGFKAASGKLELNNSELSASGVGTLSIGLGTNSNPITFNFPALW